MLYEWTYPLGQLKNAQHFILWMDSYCKAHPLNNVSQGGVSLLTELSLSAVPRR
jgi:hypothetical protein